MSISYFTNIDFLKKINDNLNMTVFIPKKGTSLYNMYAYSKIISKHYYDEEDTKGTYLVTEGVSVILYKYPHYRKAYVVKQHDDKSIIDAVGLPGIKEKTDIIYIATGRTFDLLKRMIFNMEKKYGKKIYLLPDTMWLRITSLLEKRIGQESLATENNIEKIIRPYLDKNNNSSKKKE